VKTWFLAQRITFSKRKKNKNLCRYGAVSVGPVRGARRLDDEEHIKRAAASMVGGCTS
jgi:hypothetical protein